MSEESKTPEGDYVMMGDTARVSNTKTSLLSIDDPSLSQEEKDHRLAIALQQQENAAAYGDHKKKHDEIANASQNRTGRSGTFTKLAAVRAKDHGMLSVPTQYSSEHAYHKEDGEDALPSAGFAPPPKGAHPQEVADHFLAEELQKVEMVDAGTVRTMQKMVAEEEHEEESHKLRTTRSKNTI